MGVGGGSGTYVILLPSAPTGRSKYLKTAPNHQDNSCQGDGAPNHQDNSCQGDGAPQTQQQ